MRTILWLDEIGEEDHTQVGGKALNLGRIARAGIAVPPGFCVTTAAYQDFVTANGLQPAIQALLSLPAQEARDAALRLQQAIRAGHLSAAMCEAVQTAYRRLAATEEVMRWPVAVRSSATAEDLPTASFAGLQATLLNVQDEMQLLRAILECWASLWSPRAVLYRTHREQAQQLPLIAVLVQRMVDAEAAGVVFSQHPIFGEGTVLIEAAFGLGETVVSGTGEVDRYSVDRETCAEIEPPTIAHKPQKRVMAAQGGVKSIEVPAEKRDARVLTPQEAQQVARTALALEQHLGCPQDVEWAFAEGRLYVLQSRPITAQARSYFTDVLPGDVYTWTSGFLNERFPLPVSPLGWSVIRELLEELALRAPLRYLGLKGVEQLPITKLYRGHPYVNLFVFQTLYKVFPDSLLPEDAYRYFPDGKTQLRRQAPYPRSLFDPRFLLSMACHFLREPRIWSPWHNHQVWADFVLRHEARSQELEAEWRVLREDKATVQRIWAAIDKAQQLNHELLALHRWSLTHADLTYTLLRRLVRASVKADEAAALCTVLVTGLPNKSLEVDRALHHLAQTTDPPAFAKALDAFLTRHGHRSFHLDIYYPSFGEEPGQVLELAERLRGTTKVVTTESAREQLGTTTGGTTKSAQEQLGTTTGGTTKSAQMEEARRRVHELCSAGLLGWLKRRFFDHVLYLAQRYMPLREDQRYYWQKTLALMRKLFLLLGQRLAEAHLLNQREDVFFLTKSEIEAHVRGRISGESYAALAATRRQQFTRLRQECDVAPGWRRYPPFLRGNRPLQMAEHDGQTQWTGQAVSPGLARGRAVVLFSPAELDRVKAGDILVTRSVDPGWTPIFALLGALVIEHGGQLSHGAVVAREYGLPAVAGIPGITQLLRDGDVVIVDGLHGVVAKIEEK